MDGKTSCRTLNYPESSFHTNFAGILELTRISAWVSPCSSRSAIIMQSDKENSGWLNYPCQAPHIAIHIPSMFDEIDSPYILVVFLSYQTKGRIDKVVWVII